MWVPFKLGPRRKCPGPPGDSLPLGRPLGFWEFAKLYDAATTLCYHTCLGMNIPRAGGRVQWDESMVTPVSVSPKEVRKSSTKETASPGGLIMIRERETDLGRYVGNLEGA